MQEKSNSYNSSKRIRNYYTEFGSLFREMTDGSGMLNLGFTPKGMKCAAPREAQEQLILKVAEAGGFKKDMSVLDVGCGLGGPSKIMADRFGCRVIGMDVFPPHIRKTAETAGTRVLFLCGDAMNMPFTDNSFDRVYSVESAFHYADQSRFMHESSDVLNKDGVLVIADIIGSSKRKTGGLAGLVRKAVSASGFSDRISYESEATRVGMRVTYQADITEGVLRTFPLWRKTYFQKRKILRRFYSLRTLIAVGMGLIFIPLIVRFLSFRYMILIFGFHPTIKETG